MSDVPLFQAPTLISKGASAEHGYAATFDSCTSNIELSLAHSASTNGKTGSLSEAKSRDCRDGSANSTSARFERVLRDLPPPRPHVCLQLLFALTNGVGLRWRGVYVVNVLMSLVMLTGAMCTFVYLSYGWNTLYHAVLTKYGQEVRIGVILRWVVSYQFTLQKLGPIIHLAYYINRGDLDRAFLRRGFPAPTVRTELCAPNAIASRVITPHPGFFRTYGSTFLVGLALLASALKLVTMTLFQSIPTDDFDVDMKVDGYVLVSVFGRAFSVWSIAVMGASITMVYAVCDDVTLVNQYVMQDLIQRISKQLPEASEDPTIRQDSVCRAASHAEEFYLEIIETLAELRDYTDWVLRPWKKWFVFQIVLSLLTILCFLLSSVFILLRVMKGEYPFSLFNDAAVILLMAAGYVFLLHAAARVTNTWDKELQRLLGDKRLFAMQPCQYHSLVLFLDRARGGFLVCGYRVEHKLGLKVITILLALAGLSRF